MTSALTLFLQVKEVPDMHLWHTIGYNLDMTIFGPFIGHLLLRILIE